MKIFFLDDNAGRRTDFVDNCPAGHKIFTAPHYKAAVKLFDTESPFDIMFLDHDLGQKETGHDFVKYMVETTDPNRIAKLIIVHSNNIVGGPRMVALLSDYQIHARWDMFQPTRRWISKWL